MSAPHLPFCATVGPDEPVGVIGVAIERDPLPLSDLVIERLSQALRNDVAICIYAKDKRVLDRMVAVLGMLVDPPAGGRA